jgi:hypothetical protein
MSHSYQNLELGERASLSGRGSGGYESEPSLLKQYRTVITAIGAVAVVCLVGVVAYSSRSTTLATAAGPLLSSSATTSDFDAAATTLSLAEKKSSKSSENEKGELSAPLSAEAVCLDPNYTKVTLKLANEMTMAGLFPDLKGERKFEASDVIRVENHYLVIYDNLYQIGKIHQQLDFHNTANVLLNSNPERKGDSGFEAIVYDEPSGVFYVVIEAELEAGDKFHRAHIDSVSSDKDREKLESSPSAEAQFHATIEEVEFHEDSKEYKLKDKCKTQFKFISGNKGFEGAAHVNQGEDGIIMMGLCEGNFWSVRETRESAVECATSPSRAHLCSLLTCFTSLLPPQ